LAPSSRSTYRSGWSSYLQFCSLHGLPPLPVSDLSLTYFVSALADRLLSHATIQVYLSAASYHSRLLGFPVDYDAMPRLHYVLMGIRRSQGGRLSRPPRDPIASSHLLALRRHLSRFSIPRDALMLWAAVTSAFFGLLRSSEFCCPSASSFSPATLFVSHLSFAADFSSASLFLPLSKTDPFGHGVHVSLFPLSSPLCPVSALRHFLALRSPATGPLFTFADGSFLTRAHLVALLRHVFPGQPRLNTHSFRIGGASALAAAGVPDYVIKMLGRWSSDSFLRYIRSSPRSLRSYQCRMLGGVLP
jgi:hypothetical protein